MFLVRATKEGEREKMRLTNVASSEDLICIAQRAILTLAGSIWVVELPRSQFQI